MSEGPPILASTLSTAARNELLAAACDVARMAGARADRWFARRGELRVEEKGAQDYVSAADRETEKLIVEELRARFPAHAFLGEEGHKQHPAAEQPLWVIDPIDGTTNFLRGIPLWAVSIGVVVDGVPEVGVIHLPRQDELYAATRDGGATLDGAPLCPSRTSSLGRAAVALGSSSRTPAADVVAIEAGLIQAGVDVRRLGSACVQMAWVAGGRIDGYLEPHLNAWDVAAGMVILREAGVRVSDFTAGGWLEQGNPLLCATPKIYDDIVRATGFRDG